MSIVCDISVLIIESDFIKRIKKRVLHSTHTLPMLGIHDGDDFVLRFVKQECGVGLNTQGLNTTLTFYNK